MFNLGPMEILVLVVVGVVVIGPEKLPGLMKDAARLMKTLRDLATGARQQLRDELGPEFEDVDFRNLNPRTAVQRMVFGDEDVSRYNPRNAMRDMVFGDEDREALRNADPREAWRETRRSYYDADDEPSRNGANGHANGYANGRVDVSKKPVGRPDEGRPRPRPRPAATYDDDAT